MLYLNFIENIDQITFVNTQIILVQRIINNYHIDLPNCPSASLESISVATATPHSSALRMEQLFYVNIAEIYYSLY